MNLTAQVKALMIGVENIYRGSMPDSPDSCVCIYNTGGYPRSLSGTKVEEPTFMVKVRNTSYDAGVAVCEAVKDALHGATTSKLLVIEQQGDIQDLGRDSKNRPEWTINFRCYYRR